MKKGVLYSILMGCFLTASLCMTGCGETQEHAAPPTANGQPPSLDEQVENIVKSMSTPEKIGQMVMIGVDGTDVTEDSLFMLHQYHMGGITLFDRNMESKEQVGLLTEHLQKQSGEKLPLFIAVDEEGGAVVRMRDQLPTLPAQEEIGASWDPGQAKEWAATIGKLVKDMGINTNFAPVADVGFDRGRSYGNDPDTVATFVDQACKGYEENKVYFSLKHFPGIGRGMVDSHIEVSDIDISMDELLASDLKPFRTIIESHEPDGYFVMVSHLKYPQIDPQEPASLSKAITTGILREKLGYKGIIITDDLAMGAVANHNSFRELGVKAIQAGADIALICHEYSNQQEVYLGILDAVEKGIISEERINESLRRIVKTKLKYLK